MRLRGAVHVGVSGGASIRLLSELKAAGLSSTPPVPLARERQVSVNGPVKHAARPTGT
jgi:hypothetical protein